MHMHMKNWLAAMLMVGATVGAHAQSTLQNFAYAVRPFPGVYYDPSQGGTGLTMDTVVAGAQEYAFTTYYHYTPDGAPTWLNLIAPITQTSMAEYAATGVAASVLGSWVAAAGGQCFDCAFTPNTVSYPPYGERVIDIVGGRHLRLNASGNAGVRNMKLGKALDAGGVFSKALLESGSIWEIKERAISGNTLFEGTQGWMRFRKRPTTEAKLIFSGADPRSPIPAHLDVADKNSLLQYEARCVRKNYVVGSIYTQCAFISMDNTSDPNAATIVIDPATDRIRGFRRCTLFDAVNCPHGQYGSVGTVRYVADYIEAGPDANGAARLVVRTFDLGVGGYTAEYQLTRVSEATIAEVFPGGIPADNGP